MLTIIVNFLKKYWQLCICCIVVICVYMLYLRQDTSFAVRLNELNLAHSVEITKINKINDEQVKQLEENAKELQQKLILVEEQYQIDIQTLQRKKQTIISQQEKKYNKNPDALTIDLEKILNLQVIDLRK